MNPGKLIKDFLRIPVKSSEHPVTETLPKPRSEMDIYFTAQFHAKAEQWGLTEDHARFVFWEGDPVKGKENMKVATYKGQEIGIYVFRDEQTNQPVITSIWKRQFRDRDDKKSGRSR